MQNLVAARQGTFGADWFAVTWSLAIEEQFYLVLPLLVRFAPPRYFLWIVCALIGVAPLTRYMLVDNALAAYMLMLCRMDALLLGVLVAYLVRSAPVNAWMQAHLMWVYGLAVLLFGGIVYGVIAPVELFSRTMTIWGYSWLAAFYSCLLSVVYMDRLGIVARVMRAAPLGRLGAISYGVYILHQPIIALTHATALNQVTKAQTGRDAAVTQLALAITLGLAGLSWTLFERRFVAFGHTFRYGSGSAHRE